MPVPSALLSEFHASWQHTSMKPQPHAGQVDYRLQTVSHAKMDHYSLQLNRKMHPDRCGGFFLASIRISML
jgi:hypothetical protein